MNFGKALTIVVILMLGNGMALAAKKSTTQPISYQSSAEDLKKTLKDTLLNCNSSYKSEMALMEAEVKIIYSSRRLDEQHKYESPAMSSLKAQQEVVNKKSETGYEYKKCVDAFKAAVTKETKSVLSDFKPPKLKLLAKELISQWLTAIESVGTNSFSQELAKFDKASNDLILEAMTN